MALQKKFALAFSCFILFFVGAPLGAIIRKGGMGLPMVIAIGLFLSYYFIGIFAQNSAESGSIPTFLGAWLSTLIILPLGIQLTRNATSDKGMFNTDPIVMFFVKIWNKISKKKDRVNKESFEDKDVVNELEIQPKQIIIDSDIDYEAVLKKHNFTSLVTMILFTGMFVTLIIFALILKIPFNQMILNIFSALGIVYILFYIKSYMSYQKLTKFAKPNQSVIDHIIDFFFGFTSNCIAYFYNKIEVRNSLETLEKIKNDNN